MTALIVYLLGVFSFGGWLFKTAPAPDASKLLSAALMWPSIVIAWVLDFYFE